MKAIEGKLYSPHLVISKVPVFPLSSKGVLENSSGGNVSYRTIENLNYNDATVSKIRKGDGFPVNTFRQLINEVARVTIHNKQYEMFYRGQNRDYKNCQSKFYKDKDQKTTIFPTICRPEKKEDGSYKYSIKQEMVKRRYQELHEIVRRLTSPQQEPVEYYYTLLQHYELCPTPLIDITQSLRVAATFALMGSSIGYLYVFGLPYPNQSISIYHDLGIVLVKIQNLCPEMALRPRYQEGYLVGKYPYHQAKEVNDDLSRRLVAKFKLDNRQGRFWDKDFTPMPEDVLFPKDDHIFKRLKPIVNNLKTDLGYT